MLKKISSWRSLITYHRSTKRFTTTLLEDDFGDLQLTIPYDICEEFGWDQTTEFEYEMSDDGSIHFKPLER